MQPDMKILFITTSLNPGKDGVGDYTRDLARECIRQGHTCAAVALNEHGLDAAILEPQSKPRELRLPASMTWESRFAQARKFIEEFNPTWISFQFVCFGFHPKGILWGLQRPLLSLAAGFKTHLMLHELWIGDDCGAPFKQRLLGRIQKFFVLSFIRALKPSLIHTSNSAYVALLKSCGLQASRLPLYGAVPVSTEPDSKWYRPVFRDAGLDITDENRDRFWIFGMFGSLHPVWPPEPLFGNLEQNAKLHGKELVIAAAGRLGPGQDLWARLAADYAGRIKFVYMGERPTRELSEFFKFIDFGISATPYDIVGKSASGAAMIEHGVPLIVNRTAQHFRNYVNKD